MKSAENIDELFRKTANTDESHIDSTFDDEQFWEKLQTNLKPQKKRNVWYYVAVAVIAVIFGFGILVSLPNNKKISENTNQHSLVASKPTVGIPEAIATQVIKNDFKNKVERNTDRIIEQNEIINKNDTVEEKPIEEIATVEEKRPLQESVINLANITPSMVQTKEDKKSKKPIKLKIVHANELNDFDEAIAQKQETVSSQKFVVINFKLPKTEPEQNISTLFRTK